MRRRHALRQLTCLVCTMPAAQPAVGDEAVGTIDGDLFTVGFKGTVTRTPSGSLEAEVLGSYVDAESGIELHVSEL